MYALVEGRGGTRLRPATGDERVRLGIASQRDADGLIVNHSLVGRVGLYRAAGALGL